MAYVVKSDVGHDLYRVRYPGGEHVRLFQGGRDRLQAPLFSRDGARVAWYTWTNNTWVMPTQVGAEAKTWRGCGVPNWSSDGRRFLCENVSQLTFLLKDVATGQTVGEVQHGIASAVLPSWSPSGQEVAFARRDGKRTEVWRVGVADGQAVPLAAEADENYTPVWSPDGRWIAYQSTLGSANSEIWVMTREGREARRLTITDGWSRGPAWSPDGQWLAFVSDRAGSVGFDYGEVFVVNLAGGSVYQVTHTAGQVYDWRVAWGVTP